MLHTAHPLSVALVHTDHAFRDGVRVPLGKGAGEDVGGPPPYVLALGRVSTVLWPCCCKQCPSWWLPVAASAWPSSPRSLTSRRVRLGEAERSGAWGPPGPADLHRGRRLRGKGADSRDRPSVAAGRGALGDLATLRVGSVSRRRQDPGFRITILPTKSDIPNRIR